MHKTIFTGVIAILVLGVAACGDADSTGAIAGERIAADAPADEPATSGPASEEPAPPSMGMCAPGVTDCVDTAIEPAGGQSGEPGDEGGDEFPTEAAREEARGLLGLHEADLADDVRISRRGEEQFMLTEDYVLGRNTVELEDTDGSGFRVVTVTVELPDGPETFELQPS